MQANSAMEAKASKDLTNVVLDTHTGFLTFPITDMRFAEPSFTPVNQGHLPFLFVFFLLR
jgi:hypothetical protein